MNSLELMNVFQAVKLFKHFTDMERLSGKKTLRNLYFPSVHASVICVCVIGRVRPSFLYLCVCVAGDGTPSFLSVCVGAEGKSIFPVSVCVW